MGHDFIFTPGTWEGKGLITFSMAEDLLPFSMHWNILPSEEQKISFNQIIDVEGFAEKMRNNFTLTERTTSAFEIKLENAIVGKVVGSGVITSQVIAWEFRRKDQDFEGYEIYELQPDGSYKMRGEFSSGDEFRTHVQGEIRRLPL